MWWSFLAFLGATNNNTPVVNQGHDGSGNITRNQAQRGPHDRRHNSGGEHSFVIGDTLISLMPVTQALNSLMPTNNSRRLTPDSYPSHYVAHWPARTPIPVREGQQRERIDIEVDEAFPWERPSFKDDEGRVITMPPWSVPFPPAADIEAFENERQNVRSVLYGLDIAIDLETRSIRPILPYQLEREGVTLGNMPEALHDMTRAYQTLLGWYDHMLGWGKVKSLYAYIIERQGPWYRRASLEDFDLRRKFNDWAKDPRNSWYEIEPIGFRPLGIVDGGNTEEKKVQVQLYWMPTGGVRTYGA
ncbi:hypothetical protein QBC47DRAFT_365880 [Echria macrotheca]|uniref:Uncharacterized protein n=1 Tax=Echria macrotheca TaxID=438768 RepID=A0AAJ0B1F1_9PEZI|nr:hypothetical protein QBC47DRAFT_365880 [Echria macrotheca]